MFTIDENRVSDVLFWVQTESTDKVAAMVIARIEREPEVLRAGE
jgi:hypothetical protein